MTDPVLGRPDATPSEQIDTFGVEGSLDLVHFRSSELTAVCPVTGQPDFILDRHRVPTGLRVHRDPVTEAPPPHLRRPGNLRRTPGPAYRRAPCGCRRSVGHGSPHPAGSWRNHHHGYRHQQTLGLRNRRSGPACTPGPASTLPWRHVLSVTGCATVIPPAGGSGSSCGEMNSTRTGGVHE
jgi:hypothetical protein